MFKQTWIFISYGLLNSACGEKIICSVLEEENRDLPLSFNPLVRVDYCDSSYEKCCTKGCCPNDNKSLQYAWLSLVIVTAIIIGICCACNRERICQVQETNEDPNVENAQETVSLNRTTPGILVPSAPPPEINNHPVTPPPTYDVVINNDFQVNNRIPSYEDVTMERTK